MYVFILTWIDLRERDPYSEDGLDEIRLDEIRLQVIFHLEKGSYVVCLFKLLCINQFILENRVHFRWDQIKLD